MLRSSACGALCAVLVVAAPLHAEPPAREREARDPARAARLTFARGPGAEGCPDEAALRRAVTSRLGYDPFQEKAPRTLAAVVRVSEGALRGEVTTIDAAGAVAGTRQISAAGDDCAELVAAMALAISIAIDPEVLFRPAPPGTAPAAGATPPANAPELPALPGRGAPDTPGAPETPETPRRAPAPTLLAAPLPAALAAPSPASARSIRWHVGVGGLVTSGTAPGVTGGITVDLGLRWRALSVSVEGRADIPTQVEATGGGAVRAGLFATSLVPCFHLGPAAACALGTFGALRGSGSGVPQPQTDVTPFVALGGRLGAWLPLGRRFAVGVHGDLAATPTRTTLLLGDRAVWTTPRVSAALGVGARVHFP